MNVGVLGVGIMGKNHARIYSELKSVDSLFIYDINQDMSHEVAYKYSATSCGSIESFVKYSDAISVCVPTKYHLSSVKQLLSYPCPCNLLIEKPICATFQEAKELISMNSRGVMGVGHIERFNPVISEIKKIIKNPLYIEFKRHNPASERNTGGSVVEDLMIHDIDILLHELCTSRPKNIRATGNNDVCSVLMNYKDIPVVLSASRKSSKKIRTVYIEEEDCTVEGDFMSQEVTIYRKPKHSIESDRYRQENIIEKVLVNKVEPLRVELNTFINCVKTTSTFPITPEQAMRNLEMCDDIRRCLIC
jgi:predicted dehydrogenase